MLQPKIIILMGTYNGQRFLPEQLDSLSSQTHTNWKLLVSDDGSDDNTHHILQQYQSQSGNDRICIYTGPRQGSTVNFLSLLGKEPIEEGRYFAYSDQDDVWEPDKLQRAVAWLNTVPDEIPALYCSRTKLMNDTGKSIGHSLLFRKKGAFLNALVQNIGGGNTMVFNRAVLNLLRESGNSNTNVLYHDWWTYMLATGSGGIVFYDTQPTIHYRQHDGNQIGSHLEWYGIPLRLYRLFKGNFKQCNDLNIQALLSISHLLTEENRNILNEFIMARNSWLIPRLIRLQRLGIYRQTWSGNLGLITAVLFNKI